MVQSGSAVCRKCGHFFRLMMGSESRFQIVFCEDCGHDDVAHGQIEDGVPFGACRHCGGNLDPEAKPRCRRCRSTEIEFRPDR
jgi:Zn ribbon nucleic-acid-binding protein